MRLFVCVTLLAGIAGIPVPLLAQQPAYVVNEAPRLPAARAWRVGPVLMQAGHAEDPNGLELSRVMGAIRLADGRIVVANSSSNELIFLSANGREQVRAGRGGGGPGEFGHLGEIGLTPDGKIWAADLSDRRFNLFDLAGRNAGTVSLQAFQVPGGLSPVGVLADGRFVLINATRLLGGPAKGFDSTDVIVHDPTAGRSVTIARIPKLDTGDPLGSKILGAPMLLVVGGSDILWGFGDAYRIHRVDTTGRSRGGITKRHNAVALGGALWDRYMEARAAASRAAGQTPDQIRQARQRTEASARPATLPVFSEALLDAQGNLWVRGYELSRVIVPEWDVFDSTGSWLTTLGMPERFRPMQIGPDWILGVQRDEDGVESVSLRRLIKPN